MEDQLITSRDLSKHDKGPKKQAKGRKGSHLEHKIEQNAVIVLVNVVIKKIGDIDVVCQEFEAQFDVVLEWEDPFLCKSEDKVVQAAYKKAMADLGNQHEISDYELDEGLWPHAFNSEIVFPNCKDLKRMDLEDSLVGEARCYVIGRNRHLTVLWDDPSSIMTAGIQGARWPECEGAPQAFLLDATDHGCVWHVFCEPRSRHIPVRVSQPVSVFLYRVLTPDPRSLWLRSFHHLHVMCTSNHEAHELDFEIPRKDRLEISSVVDLNTLMRDTEDDPLDPNALQIDKFDLHEWHLLRTQMQIFELVHGSFNDGESGEMYEVLDISFQVSRKAWYYGFNIVIPMFVVTSLGAVIFTVPPLEGMSSRLGLSFTLILAVTAFKYVATENLPKTAYQTILDQVCSLAVALFAPIINH
jgi:hypothetical protein